MHGWALRRAKAVVRSKTSVIFPFSFFFPSFDPRLPLLPFIRSHFPEDAHKVSSDDLLYFRLGVPAAQEGSRD